MRLNIAVVGAGSMGVRRVCMVGTESCAPYLQNSVSRFHDSGYGKYRETVAQPQPDPVAVAGPAAKSQRL